MSTIAKRSLEELEQQAMRSDGPLLVAGLPLNPGGVDPLGLRQLNFNLMDDLLPGLNNVASRMRVYVFLAWAWWKAGELGKCAGSAHVKAEQLRAFVDRMEVLYAVSHLVHEDFVGLLGRDTLNTRVLRLGGFDFSAASWTKFRKDRELVSSFMAPVAYGPSAKVGPGLGFILPVEGGAFVPVDEVMPAVLAFDEKIHSILERPAFSNLDGGWVSLEEMQNLYSVWRAGDLSDPEIEVGTARLYGKSNAAPRTRSIDLILFLITSADGALTVNEIRRALGSGHLRGQKLTIPDNLSATAGMWRALLARQLLRLSLESLLNWTLAECAVPSSLGSLSARLFESIGGADYANAAQWLQSRVWKGDIADPITNPVELTEIIEDAQQLERPDIALDGIKAALEIARAAPDKAAYGGQADRLPLTGLLDRVGRMAELPFQEALEIILSEWIIGQHVYWAVGRSGDDTQRLRLMLDEGGWLSFYARPGNARSTPDRLATVLRLMADCQLCKETIVDGQSRYSVN